MKRRHLSREDRDVWERYSKSTDPLARRPVAAPPEAAAPKVPVPQVPQSAAPFQLGQKARARGSTVSPAPSLPDQIARQPLRMDAKTHRRMTSGKLRPEGKLDLHGMTLDRAHGALQRFVLSRHAEGARLLLVVTGKGKSKPSVGPIPNRLGVLKHQVPQWLRMAPLAAVVLQVTEAHRSHGGSGAYYVYLRRT